MKASFRILTVVLLLAMTLSALAGCNLLNPQQSTTTTTTTTTVTTTKKPSVTTTTKDNGDDNPPSPDDFVDYVAKVKLDLTSDRLRQEVTVKLYVDGDTTHFNVPKTIAANGVLKARYLAVNTPESTGTIEEWGKAASEFTRSKLESAVSIIIESDDGNWNLDSTGARHLVWVWYKPSETEDYRNLNLELLQEGLAIASNSANNSYGDYCVAAIDQAKAYKLYVYSGEKDPDFFYGEAITVSLKEVATNPEKYVGKKVAFTGLISKNDGSSIYMEEYDEETEMYLGVTCYMGFNLSGKGKEILTPGNVVMMVGSVQEYNGTYQISDLKYNIMRPNDPNNFKLISTGGTPAFTLVDAKTFLTSKRSVTIIGDYDEETETYEETVEEWTYAKLALNTSIEMKGLKVTSIYTTDNGGDSDGAMTLTCTVDGMTITVRTEVLLVDGNRITEDYFKGKTIDVKGIVGYYNGNYQIKLLSINDVVIK